MEVQPVQQAQLAAWGLLVLAVVLLVQLVRLALGVRQARRVLTDLLAQARLALLERGGLLVPRVDRLARLERLDLLAQLVRLAAQVPRERQVTGGQLAQLALRGQQEQRLLQTEPTARLQFPALLGILFLLLLLAAR